PVRVRHTRGTGCARPAGQAAGTWPPPRRCYGLPRGRVAYHAAMSTMFLAFRRARALLVGVLAVLGLVAVGTAAAAHDVLIESDPAEGAVLDRSPEAVVLTFNNPPLEVGSAITVVDADGQTVVEGAGRRSEEHTSDLQSRRNIVC